MFSHFANERLDIPRSLVVKLLKEQFPHWSHLEVIPVEPGGWDNRTFRLGRDMSIRLPSAQSYEVQVHKEHIWLPKLACHFSVSIAQPIALGRPSKDYPFYWSIYRWIEGESAHNVSLSDAELQKLAFDIAQFLRDLQHIKTDGGPLPGPHNYHRGGNLTHYDNETRLSIVQCQSFINADLATSVWEQALSSRWDKKPVWIHGDLSAGNILLENGRLVAVIDFGCLGIGDPSCDLVIAWTLLHKESRKIFQSELTLDQNTWLRAKGWALWKALITFSNIEDKYSIQANTQLAIIEEILADNSSCK